MPPKQRITREMILERSFEMFCCEGMEAINARSVAKALNCSTQPIFSYFSGMEDLKTALEQKAKELFEAALKVDDMPGNPLVNICCAYVRFAAEQPCLFMHLFMINKDDPLYPFMSEEERQALIAREAQETGLPIEQAAKVFVQMTVYSHGLAAVRAAHKVDFGVERMSEMIEWAHKTTLCAVKQFLAHPEGC